MASPRSYRNAAPTGEPAQPRTDVSTHQAVRKRRVVDIEEVGEPQKLGRGVELAASVRFTSIVACEQ